MIHKSHTYHGSYFGLCAALEPQFSALDRLHLVANGEHAIFLGACPMDTRRWMQLCHFYAGGKIICASREFAEHMFKEIER